jgi:chaperonin GroES|tara:strand:+ start:25049 stop:25378 length:330 start_codon:yes stop_codon:yes gene_type:complete
MKINKNNNMNVNFKPLGDRVLIKPTEKQETKSKGGIILTDSILKGKKVFGEVIAVGTGIFTQTGESIPMIVSVGDKVMYKKDMGSEDVTINDEKYLLFREHELLGILNE